MAEHLFQVNGFNNFQNGNAMRQSPVLIHNSLSGSFTSKIEVTNSEDLTSVYLCLRSSRERSICTDIPITFSVINQYSNDHYTSKPLSYMCGLFGNQVFGCQFLTSRILTESGLCIDDVITILVHFSLQANSIIVPAFGDPSAVATINHQTASCNAKQFMDQEFAETKFQVGRNNSQLFYGHRVIIAPACPVLKQMMISSKDHVVIEDVAMTVFLTIMRYIYCHEIMIDKGFVYETLAAADKFEMPDITFAVAALIDLSILPVVCNYTTASESNRFGSLCSLMIRQNVDAFLTPERFMQLTQASVAMIVADHELACDEILLWDICMDWARQECENRLGKAATAKDIRLAMKPFFSDFRFRFMSLEDFTRGPADSGILKLVEVVDVYKFFASATPLTFFTNEKRGPVTI